MTSTLHSTGTQQAGRNGAETADRLSGVKLGNMRLKVMRIEDYLPENESNDAFT